MDPNAGVRRQAMGQLERRAGADLATMPRIPRGNQFAEAGEMALEGTGLPSVRRGAETLTGVARNPSQPNAPMRALGGLGELGLGVASAATIGEFGGVRPRGRVPMQAPPRMPAAPAAPQSDPEALSLARSWIDSFGGGPSAEARAIEVMTEHMQEARNPAWRQRLADAIDSVGSRAYVQGERTSFSQRVEDAWPEIYGGAAAPDPSPPLTRPPTQIAPNGMPIRPPQPFRNSLRGGNDDLAEAASFGRAPDVGNAGGGRVAYRGLNRPYDPNNGGYYQSFTSSLDDAREYGPNVMAANLQLGRNLAIDGGGNNFSALSVSQLPADVRARLHPSIEASATTDQIAHAAREAGYDSVTVRNVHDNRWGERPARGSEPRTIDFVFDTRNISPLDSIPEQASSSRAPEGRVRLSAADRALLDELELDPNAPARGDGQFSRAPGIAPQQAPPRTSPRLFPSPNTPRTRPQAPAGTGDMQPEGIFADGTPRARRRAARYGLDEESGVSKAELRSELYSRRFGENAGWVEDFGPPSSASVNTDYTSAFDPDVSIAKNAQAMLRELLEWNDGWRSTPAKRQYMLNRARQIRENDLRSNSNWMRDVYNVKDGQ